MAAAKDFYEILGVSKTASDAEIKAAYKKLVVKYHPDKFTDEVKKKEANAKFQEIQGAYDILKDPKKREQYNRFGASAFEGGGSGHAGFEGFDFSGGGFESVFNEFFSGFGGSSRGGYQEKEVFKGEDLQFSIEISLEEAFVGYESFIKIPRKVACSVCSSSGKDVSSASVKCSACNGAGRVYVNQLFFRVEQVCGSCNGSGQSYKKCSACYGEGRKSESSEVKISIPRGVENGMKLRMKGKGNAAKGGINGDLYIFVSIKQHSIFSVKNSDLLLTVPVSVFDAVLGTQIEIPTLDKSRCKVIIPAGSQPGSLINVKGKGMYQFNSSYYRGNILITLEVEIPKIANKEETELWQKLQTESIKSSKSRSFWDKIFSYWS